jgi:hypothetical protein
MAARPSTLPWKLVTGTLVSCFMLTNISPPEGAPHIRHLSQDARSPNDSHVVHHVINVPCPCVPCSYTFRAPPGRCDSVKSDQFPNNQNAALFFTFFLIRQIYSNLNMTLFHVITTIFCVNRYRRFYY